MGDEIIFEAKRVGERYATKVRVRSPQGSHYDGWKGVVALYMKEARTAIVRFKLPGNQEIELPFGRGELEVIQVSGGETPRVTR